MSASISNVITNNLGNYNLSGWV